MPAVSFPAQATISAQAAFTLTGNTRYYQNIDSIPSINTATTSFIQIQDKKTGKCWDANTLALGANLNLQKCAAYGTPRAFSQSFNTVGQVATVSHNAAKLLSLTQLAIPVNSTFSYCVDLKQGSLALSACNAKSFTQSFNLTTPYPWLQGKGFCGYGEQQTVSLYEANYCSGPAAVNYLPSAQPVYTVVPDVISIYIANGLCFDATNPKQIEAKKCVGSPQQNWYTLFGQIRNVGTGLCLDAPGANGTRPEQDPVAISLRACGGWPPIPTQLWLYQGESLLNAESVNCIRAVPAGNTNKLWLGTAQCSKRDKFAKFAKRVTGLKGFESKVKTSGATCDQPRQRKDVRDLSKDEIQTYFDTVTKLHSLPSVLGRQDRLTDFAACHSIGQAMYHSLPMFLPWHRMFLRVLEQDYQTINGNDSFAIPYWDWTADHNDWWDPATGVLSSNMFGTSGLGNPNNCILDGFMQGHWRPADNNRCLIRGYNGAFEKTAQELGLYSEEFVTLMISADPFSKRPYASYDDFRGACESGPHNNFHNVVGYLDNAQMLSASTSGLDPVFYLHHANVDRMYYLWQQWQKENNASPEQPYGHALQYNGITWWPANSLLQVPALPTDLMPSFNQPVSAGVGFDSAEYCHTYEPYSGALMAVAAQQHQVFPRGNDGKIHKEHIHDKVSKLDKTFCSKNKGKSKKPKKSGRHKVAKMRPIVMEKMRTRHSHGDQKKIEKQSAAMQREIENEADLWLEQLFDVDFARATPHQLAVATKYAIAAILHRFHKQ